MRMQQLFKGRRLLLPVFSILCLPGCVESQKPNVVFFLVDDLGWTDLACYGSDLYQTPNIDRLAAEGVRFTSAYSACTVCSPTRASIMTGKYPAKLRFTNIPDGGNPKPFARLGSPDFTRYLDLEEYTLAEALRDGGYTTIHLGKWHQGGDEKYWPENQGFDINIGGWRPGMPIRGEKSNGFFAPYGNPRLPDGETGEYLTERLADEAVRFIDNQKGEKKPFFMNFWFYTVHVPLQAREEKVRKYEALADTTLQHSNPVYAAMVEHLDNAVGRVMTALQENGFDNNTIVIFASDNGGFPGGSFSTPQKVTSNAPLRSGKGDMFEGGVRVPFILRWNGKIKPGTTSDTPIISCDIYPTLLSLTKTPGSPIQNENMDGIDLSDFLLKGKPIEREALFWHFPHYHPFGAKPYSAILKNDWKLIEVFEYEQPMLYNLRSDLGETMNLAADFPDKVRELQSELENWRTRLDVQYPVENPNYHPRFYNETYRPDWRGLNNKQIIEKLEKN